MAANTYELWPLPDGLTHLGLTAAEEIRGFLDDKGLAFHGGGGRFYTPEQWSERGESYGRTSLLVITHDGGDHAGAFNLDYEQYELVEELRLRLKARGVFVEACTSWYSAVYPIREIYPIRAR